MKLRAVFCSVTLDVPQWKELNLHNVTLRGYQVCGRLGRILSYFFKNNVQSCIILMLVEKVKPVLKNAK